MKDLKKKKRKGNRVTINDKGKGIDSESSEDVKFIVKKYIVEKISR